MFITIKELALVDTDGILVGTIQCTQNYPHTLSPSYVILRLPSFGLGISDETVHL